MTRMKGILGLVLIFVMVAASVPSVAAAAPAQTINIEGTIQSCETATDVFSGDIIVVCIVNLTGGGTQTIRLSVDDAVALELAVQNEDGTVTIIATEGQIVSIDPDLVMADPCVLPEDASHPISKALTNYFCDDLGLDYNTVQSLHGEGLGFGLIAQACFMAEKLGGTGSMCVDILHAKKSGDYSKLTLPDGVTVKNWGQLKKVVSSHDPKDKTNLGTIVSGDAKDNGKGNDKEKNDHGKGKK